MVEPVIWDITSWFFVGVTLQALLGCEAAPTAACGATPNIIFIHVDSMDGRTALEDSPALTPNLDKLARRGVRFDNTYCASPECVPSRSALWSGRRPDQTGVWANGHGLPPDYPIIMEQVSKVGYDTQFIGRHDFSGKHHTLSANLSTWVRPVPYFAIPSEDRPEPLLQLNATRQVHTADWRRAGKCTDWLKGRLNSTKPFMLSCGFTCPHPAYSTSPYWLENGVDKTRITMPRWKAEKDMHPVQRYETITKNCSGNWSADTVRDIRAFYYAMVAEADGFVGSVLDMIASSSLLHNTVVVFWSDHGDMAMDHKQFYKETALEGSARVPLIIAGPPRSGIHHGVTVQRPTSLIDLFPTVMDLAKAQHPAGLTGYSLLPDLMNASSMHAWFDAGVPASASRFDELMGDSHPDYVLLQAHMDHSNTGQFMLRQDNWKYIEYAGDYDPELFDLNSDPNELISVATSQPAILSQFRALLRDLLDPDEVDARAKAFDKQSFLTWRTSLGDKYNETIGSSDLRWYWAWHKDSELYLSLIDKWLKS
ncbi:arylsulfatase K-like [Sycon ciliatum]|uniref:arylsulfatase K-like n=1 Tax=Sycon ciliatum TaxID=27933 RepID=UPI0031F64CC0